MLSLAAYPSIFAAYPKQIYPPVNFHIDPALSPGLDDEFRLRIGDFQGQQDNLPECISRYFPLNLPFVADCQMESSIYSG